MNDSVGSRELCVKMMAGISDLLKYYEALPHEASVVLSTLLLTEMLKMKPVEREDCIRTTAILLGLVRDQPQPKPKPKRWFSFFLPD